MTSAFSIADKHPMHMFRILFNSYQLGPLTLRNRIVMAPLTRSRAGKGEVPQELNAEYYAQRAGAGLIISEATQVSQLGQGYLWTPGIFTAAQTAGWKKVVEAVHSKGSRIFLQMWHVGRISHTTLQPGGQAPISSTEEAAEGTFAFALDEAGKPAQLPASKPRLASLDDLEQVLDDYAHGALLAKEAGFDGIEVHGANGYLFDQFLNSAVNNRSDIYGTQSKETRTRLLLEAYDRVAEVFGANRVGVRISPFGSFGGMKADPKVMETFLYLGEELKRRGAVYVHIVRGSQNDPDPVVPEEFFKVFRETFGQTIIVTGGLDQQTAEQLLEQDVADLTGFGTLFISNPDLPARFQNNWPLAEPDQTTFYGGSARGYTDYPSYQVEFANAEPITS